MKRHIRNAFERGLKLIDDGLEIAAILATVEEKYNLTENEVREVHGYIQWEIDLV